MALLSMLPATRDEGWSRAWLQGASVLLLFVALAILLTWPLAAHLATHIPGTGLDDNAMFLWNFWWVRQALSEPGASVFATSAVFHPGGVNLVLHSQSLVNAVAGATVFGALSLPAALNLTVIGACALNGFTVSLLARRFTRDWRSAIAAGVFFAACPVLTLHMFGHFNYYTAWPLAAFCLAWLAAAERPSWHSIPLAGALLAVVAYADYYYFVYAIVFGGLMIAGRLVDIDLARRTPSWTRTDRVLLVLAALAAGVAVLVRVTGGGAWRLGPLVVSLRNGTNVRAAAVAFVVWWLWRRRTLRVTGSTGAAGGRQLALVGAGTAAVAALCMAPILFHAYGLVRDGQYVTQSYVWRSAPGGVDLAGVVAGNPLNPFWGAAVRWFYGLTKMDTVNDPIWFGIVPLVLLITRRNWIALRAARRWLLVTAVFLVWALGPFLTIFGFDTGLPLPEILLRYVPVVSNARIPAHAAVMVCLGLAMLLAVAIASSPRLRSGGAVMALVAAILIDLCAVPVPLTPLERPPLYERLAAMPPGVVLDVPTGIRDGFGPEGVFDASVLYFQTLHGKPIATGYVARLPPAVRQRYETSPVMQTLFHLSSGDEAYPALDPAHARESLVRDWHVRYVVVHEPIATPSVRRLVEAMGGAPIDRDRTRVVYRLESIAAGGDGGDGGN
jgi:hypothetical protein